MAAKLHLDRPGPDGRCPVRLIFYRDYQQRSVSLPIRISPKYWNRRRQRLKSTAPGSVEINAALERILALAETLLLSGRPLDEIQQELRRAIGRGQAHPETLLVLFDRWVALNSVRWRPSTRRVLQRVRRPLERFAPRATPADVGPDFLQRFQRFLVEDWGYRPTTANRTTKYVRSFLIWCHKQGYLERIPEARPLPEPPKHVVFLNLDELKALERLDLSDWPEGYRRARFLFLLAAVTGLRAGDLAAAMRLEAWRFIDLDRGVWLIYERKRGHYREWPLVRKARELLRSRLGEPTPVPPISLQVANRYIKRLCRAAGITQPIRLGAEEIPKADLITLHSARRSFITVVAHAVGLTHLVDLTHSDVGVLQKSYLGSIDQARREAIEKAFRGLL